MGKYFNRLISHSGLLLQRLFTLVTQPLFILLTLVLHGSMLLGAWLFQLAEKAVNPKASEFFDCVYWAFTTVTTVGYGDLVPLTYQGKWIAMFLMITGSVVAVLYTALFATALISPEIEMMQDRVKQINRDTHTLKNEEERIKQHH